LEVEVSLTSESQFFSGLSGDLFEGGLFIETYRRLPLGTMLELEIDLPDVSVTATGCVQWARDAATGSPSGVGVVLIGLSSDDRARVEQFCQLRAPLYYEP
jgi:uncharacterized protein (TIGR02266 family)